MSLQKIINHGLQKGLPNTVRHKTKLYFQYKKDPCTVEERYK